jgi:Helix-turn-helix domain
VEKLLTEAEAAEILGVQPRTLKAWRYGERREASYGPHPIRVGNRIRYEPDELRRWIEAQRRASEGAP